MAQPIDMLRCSRCDSLGCLKRGRNSRKWYGARLRVKQPESRGGESSWPVSFPRSPRLWPRHLPTLTNFANTSSRLKASPSSSLSKKGDSKCPDGSGRGRPLDSRRDDSATFLLQILGILLQFFRYYGHRRPVLRIPFKQRGRDL